MRPASRADHGTIYQAIMALSARSIRIIAASALSLVLIVGAYVTSGPIDFLRSRVADAQSTESLLKAYAAKDSDGDALPDWQEALYGTDPNNAHSFDKTLTDNEAVNKGLVTPKTSAVVPVDPALDTPDTAADVPGKDPAPGSITDEFGRQFFQEYVAASNGGQLSEEDKDALIAKLLAQYSQKASTVLISTYTPVSVRTSSDVTITEYAESIEQVVRQNDVPPDASDPVTLMQGFLEDSDPAAYKKLVGLSKAYSGITKDLLSVTVPPQLASEHLALIQSFDTLARSTKAVTKYEDDPLAVLGSLSLLQPTVHTLMLSLLTTGRGVIAESGEPSDGMPGALILKVVRAAGEQP